MAWIRIVFCIVLLFGSVKGSKAKGDVIALGVAKVDITPRSPIRLTGYQARTKVSEGVDLRLWAKAIAIGDVAEKTAILLTVDNLGVGSEIVEEVAKRLKQAVGIERSRFVVCSSHTHSAPCLTGIAPNIFGKAIEPDEQKVIDEYTRDLVDHLEWVCLQALRERGPGRLDWSEGHVDFAFNRRTKGGPVDHALPVLRLSDRNGGLKAILVNYACHCTSIDPGVNKIDGDWAGYAQAAIEANHPGVIALTAIGCGADANPERSKPGTESARGNGLMVAEEVDRMLKGDWKPIDGPPVTTFKRFTLDFDTLPNRSELENLKGKGSAIGYNASVQIAKLDQGIPLQDKLNYSVQTWTFGDDLAMVFLPGEVVVDYVLRLKQDYDPKRLWVSAYSNDLPCYIPSERILKEGGYEGGGAMPYYARPTKLASGLEKRILDAIAEIMPANFRAKSTENANP